MNDAVICELARRAGVAVEWKDYADRPQRVQIATLKSILAAIGLPCDDPEDVAESGRRLQTETLPALVTATAGQPIDLPISFDRTPRRARVVREDDGVIEIAVLEKGRRTELAPFESPGYYRVEIDDRCVTVAIAPPRCPTVSDIAPGRRLCGLAAQTYGLCHQGDCGIGDVGGIIALARKAAAQKIDLLALSPMHALFSAEPRYFSPYAPSSRLFYNPLHCDARILFGEERVNMAASAAGMADMAIGLQQRDLIDWDQSARTKISIMRALFEDFRQTDVATTSALAAHFDTFRTAGGRLLEDHARFEALHAHMLRGDRGAWAWRAWPAAFRDPENEEVGRFADANNTEVSFHCFLQWLSDCSLESAQHEAKQAGMRVGLVADLAVGMSGDGSNAWTCQKDVLTNLEIGAPPDLYNAKGQNWGLTTFSPRALSGNGFAPFIATLRACLRHVGGLRIDHAMSLLRLWVVPRGADASHGAYLTYPIDDLMRLNLLEAHRHGAILIGEDLGTVPTGFRERMTGAGVYGMRVLWFEREHNHFTPPQAWDACAAAMTSTHDLPTISGWWRGVDIDSRAEAGMVVDAASERTTRAKEKRLLWRAFRRAAAAQGDRPASSDPAPVVDAAIKFIARTPSQIALLPMEDALALEEQPNVPGTIDEFPNWRRRYPGPAEKLLDDAGVAARLKTLVDGPNR